MVGGDAGEAPRLVRSDRHRRRTGRLPISISSGMRAGSAPSRRLGARARRNAHDARQGASSPRPRNGDSHPLSVAAGRDQVAHSVERERVHRVATRLAAFASSYLENARAPNADPEPCHPSDEPVNDVTGEPVGLDVTLRQEEWRVPARRGSRDRSPVYAPSRSLTPGSSAEGLGCSPPVREGLVTSGRSPRGLVRNRARCACTSGFARLGSAGRPEIRGSSERGEGCSTAPTPASCFSRPAW